MSIFEVLVLCGLGAVFSSIYTMYKLLINNTIILRPKENNMSEEKYTVESNSSEDLMQAGMQVKLKRYVPNVDNFEDLNRFLESIGAVVILTEDRELDSVGHDPELWRLQEEEEEAQ